MARVRATLNLNTEVALVAATTKTVIQLAAAANHPAVLKAASLSFSGVSVVAEPVVVQLLRQTNAGTMTGQALVEDTAFGVTIQTGGQINASSEPTPGAILRSYNVHPQGGVVDKWNLEDEIVIGAGTRLGIRATAPAGVDCIGFASIEE